MVVVGEGGGGGLCHAYLSVNPGGRGWYAGVPSRPAEGGAPLHCLTGPSGWTRQPGPEAPIRWLGR